jgi:hypothetical protein
VDSVNYKVERWHYVNFITDQNSQDKKYLNKFTSNMQKRAEEEFIEYIRAHPELFEITTRYDKEMQRTEITTELKFLQREDNGD